MKEIFLKKKNQKKKKAIGMCCLTNGWSTRNREKKPTIRSLHLIG
jgi:hypothetical protein